MNWIWLWHQLLIHLVNASAWLIGGLGGLAILSFGPLGRALRERIRAGAARDTIDAGDSAQLATTTRDVDELRERVDYLEHLLAERHDPQPLPAAGAERDG